MRNIICLTALVVMFNISNAQILISQQSQNKKFTSKETALPPEQDSTRFIMIGASILNNTFFNSGVAIDKINQDYPGNNVSIHNDAVVGSNIAWWRTNINTVLNNYDYDPTIATYCIIHVGGNDVTDTRPYEDLTSTQINNLTEGLIFILDAIEAKGFTPILNDLTFRDYGNSIEDESEGSAPYNDNIIKPLILSRTPEFAFPDGQSFWQPYVIVYNNESTWLSTDGIHFTGTGVTGWKNHFVNTICKYIFTGIPPTKIEKE